MITLLVVLVAMVAGALAMYFHMRVGRLSGHVEKLLREGICPACGGEDLRRDQVYSASHRFVPFYFCRDCGNAFRIPQAVITNRIRAALGRKLDERVAKIDDQERRH